VRGASVDIDMRVNAALTDQFQRVEPRDERRADLGAFTDQHQGVGIAQSLREHVEILNMVVPDRDVVARELLEAIERAQGVEIVVEDGDFHAVARAV